MYSDIKNSDYKTKKTSFNNNYDNTFIDLGFWNWHSAWQIMVLAGIHLKKWVFEYYISSVQTRR